MHHNHKRNNNMATKHSKSFRVLIDAVLILFSLGQLLVIAYFNLRPHVNDCSGPGFADGCTSGVFGVIGTLIGLLYMAALVVIFIKSSVSLYRTLHHKKVTE